MIYYQPRGKFSPFWKIFISSPFALDCLIVLWMLLDLEVASSFSGLKTVANKTVHRVYLLVLLVPFLACVPIL